MLESIRMSDSRNPVVVFHQNVPEMFLLHSLERLTKAYAAAELYVSEAFPREEAHDLLGHQVRARFEATWRALQFIPDHRAAGLTGRVERNRRRTSYYTVMQCGVAAMTASAVPDPEQIVRNAAFRNVFAAPQGNLYMQTPDREVAQIYGILLHGRVSSRQPGVLGFAHVVFPICDQTQKCITGYWPDRIDLLREFGSIVRATEGVPEEKVLDTLRIELKRQKGIG